MQPEELVVTIGRNIRKRRMELGLTQVDLAERLGITQTYLSDVEQGKRTPRTPRLAKFAEALEVNPTYLVDPQPVAAV